MVLSANVILIDDHESTRSMSPALFPLKFYPVGSWVAPTQDSQNYGGGFLYRAGKPYEVIMVDNEWNYLKRDDAYGLIGVNGNILRPCEPPEPAIIMLEPDFSLEEMALGADLIGNGSLDNSIG